MDTLNAPIVSLVAALTPVVAWTASLGRAAKLKRVRWSNRTGGNSTLRIGYNDLAAAFVQVYPDILMTPGMDDELTADQLGTVGNCPYGFIASTIGTGSNGNIAVLATVAGVAPANVQVTIQVEEDF